ncbi:hypothetical protein [Planococcus rifietoensis]|uniref:Uncharacterized protein n=1 Tax=Planococcus rifietoensis TaxID=200991 RepID=A0A0U2Z4J2_9BACL|nr:hypothetical protein [Planococcus rifietoensis]ALS74116.1 hypothetical protein AUC31_02080 [Planococcus rifietoensis]
MPRTIMGKLSLVMLLILVIQIISIVIMLFVNGLAALTIILYAFVSAPLGILFGIAGIIKESGSIVIVHWVTTIISVTLLILFFITLFGFSFGG